MKILAALVVVAVLVGLGAGALPVAPHLVPMALLARLGAPIDVDPMVVTVVADLRAPRVVLGLVTGAALSTTGALLQGLFRNPLADPALIGVSGGAAFGAGLATVVGLTLLGAWGQPALAFLGGLGAVALVWRFAAVSGSASASALLLAGIAVNALAGAALSLVLVVARESQVVSITFWTMGSLGSASWRSLAVIGPLVALGVLASWTLAKPLDALLLGEREAGHLGVDVRGLRLKVVVVAAVLTGAAVSSAGILSFVGLVVPHLVRMGWGPAHRFLLPASAVLGGALLVLADTASRTVWAPTELPIGTLTTLLGGPFFLVLLRREARWLS